MQAVVELLPEQVRVLAHHVHIARLRAGEFMHGQDTSWAGLLIIVVGRHINQPVFWRQAAVSYYRLLLLPQP